MVAMPARLQRFSFLEDRTEHRILQSRGVLPLHPCSVPGKMGPDQGNQRRDSASDSSGLAPSICLRVLGSRSFLRFGPPASPCPHLPLQPANTRARRYLPLTQLYTADYLGTSSH